MYHWRLNGTPVEIGTRIGNIFKRCNAEFPIVLDDFQMSYGIESGKLLKEYFPEAYDEVKAITDVIGYPHDKFLAWMMCMGCCLDIDENRCAEVRGCTAFAFTCEGKTYYARTNDLPPFLKKISKSILYQPKGGYKFLLNSSSFTNGEEGMNEHGLVAAMTFAVPKITEIKPGLNSVFLVRYLLEKCRTADEGICAIQRLPVSSNCNILIADKTGRMVVVECNPLEKHVRVPQTNEYGKQEDWEFVDIYADEAITGTKVDKRENFQRLVNDCSNGLIDLVVTKSISRFARNTLDTLKYVRLFKEKNVAVLFEEEKINTMTMDGELLLVVLSSVAQQEVENISANVKKGLKMKMQRGEMVGYNGCLGYDYHPKDKSLTINEDEAEIVRYIFNRYIEGAGAHIIAKELRAQGIRSKRGSLKWHESTIRGIIRNEKYIGDMLMGKTFTVDPISKRRLANLGEEDKVYIRNHHEPIVTKAVFYKAQEILAERSGSRVLGEAFNRKKYSRQFAFSSLIKCGFCGNSLSRRTWNSGSKYEKTIWHCVAHTQRGSRYCPNSKGIDEKVIEQAFVESYNRI